MPKLLRQLGARLASRTLRTGKKYAAPCLVGNVVDANAAIERVGRKNAATIQ